MKLKVASYHNGNENWNAQVEDIKLRPYRIDHAFNSPARLEITLADVDGSRLRKYNVDPNDVYIGIARVEIEDPDGTSMFFGRILKALGDTDITVRTLILECEDMMGQLKDKEHTYDMREKLGTTDLRQSSARMDKTDFLVASNVAGDFFFYDDGEYDTDGGMAFVNDAYNGMKLFFTTEMAGTRTWRFYAYKGVDAGDPPAYADHWYNTWTPDDSEWDRCFDGVNDEWTLVYTFRAEVGHNTPSDFYVHDSISSAVIYIKYLTTFSAGAGHIHLEIWDNNAAAYVVLDELEEVHHAREVTYTISNDILPYIVDASGEIKIRFDTDVQGGSSDFFVYRCWIDVTTKTIPYSQSVTINDTINPNKLEVATDLTAAATRIWEGIRYCIAKPINLHINGLVTDNDSQFIMTTSVESTTGISTRQYKDKNTLAMMRDLARQDKAVFYTALGTAEVIWQQTFGAHTVHLTDADVDSWRSLWDYNTMFNRARVYGARINDYEIFQEVGDATSETKFRISKTKTIKNTGLVTDADAKAVATALSARDSDPIQIISCVISGNTFHAAHPTTVVLGDVVEITSSYLWSTASKDYVVVRWGYDSSVHKTYLTLHPKSSIGYQDIDFADSQGTRMMNAIADVNSDKFIPDNITQEVG